MTDDNQFFEENQTLLDMSEELYEQLKTMFYEDDMFWRSNLNTLTHEQNFEDQIFVDFTLQHCRFYRN